MTNAAAILMMVLFFTRFSLAVIAAQLQRFRVGKRFQLFGAV